MTLVAEVDAPRSQHAPIDPNVILPPSVIAAAKRAEAYYKPVPETVPDPAAPPAPPAIADPAAPPPPAPPPVAAPADPDPLDPATPREQVPPDQWEHRYNSMKGRYDQAVGQIAQLQEQMIALGDELQQRIVNTRTEAAPPPPVSSITDKDREEYGEPMLDLVARVAKEVATQALRPEIDGIKQHVSRTTKQTLVQQLDAGVPNWRAINTSPEFKAWLRLPDLYSGQLRSALAEDARRAADAPRLIAFFQGFLKEEAALGRTPAPASTEPPAPPAPRQAAVPLETLTAPGRARPAGGDTTVSVDKPVFTRAQIKAFYANVRGNYYAGRVAEKDALERQIFAAQREGRVRD